MELVIRFLVWVFNCFLSGKAQALGIVVFGFFLSYLFLNISPVIIKVAMFIYPSVEQYIREHEVGFQIFYFSVFLLPILICSYIAFKQLQLIYFKESCRGF
ncbi:hypothetical protein [Acinetobacter haemolyticus]|uniref:hypothetical protein n=1 Tax=Acinetobacter haemolyticus TaxID=29430 RepID=UPI0021CD51B3|nr:hypothetical protein [Acinetobacter haemolyticus]MCU4377623.1 hypothetical protein [Acinetobacter haemolyticus]